MNNNDFDYSPKSAYNEAAFFVQRLNLLQMRINAVRVNPLAWNPEQESYNYKIWFYDLCSLLNEIWSKLKDTEQKDMELLRSQLSNALKYMPPHKLITRCYSKGETIVSAKNWQLMEDGLIMFEKKIKTYLNDYGLSNPDMEGGDLF